MSVLNYLQCPDVILYSVQDVLPIELVLQQWVLAPLTIEKRLQVTKFNVFLNYAFDHANVVVLLHVLSVKCVNGSVLLTVCQHIPLESVSNVTCTSLSA